MRRHSELSRRNPLHDLQLYHCILLDRYEIIQAIGDGSFGTVSLGRKRKLGHSAQLVAIKSMKKPIDPPQDCLKLREIQSLHVIPKHPAIVPVLESFYDPSTRLFHMVMEHMEQNLYQLIKSRNGEAFDWPTVKTILSQILDGLRHCHYHNYFHRDIKPENILVTCSRKHSAMNAMSSIAKFSAKPYCSSRFITPPATPVDYCVKLADFGLAREIDSRPPYTIYVSTRWYRAPEVLLRAGEYSAPVDMWAFGAMAVELATLKPLFPGSHEIDQVWKVCEIMGSPGDWRDRSQKPVGGGIWDEGYKLAENLGFTFPKTTPKPLEGIIGCNWPSSFCQLVTRLLAWNPAARPTSADSLQHELFRVHDSRAQSPVSKMPHGHRASLPPWVDRTHIIAEPNRDSTGNVHESLQRRLCAQHGNRNSIDNDLQAWPIQPGSQQSLDTELVASSPHRLSWFARKRNSIICRAPKLLRDDVTQIKTPEKYKSSPKDTTVIVKTQPIHHGYGSEFDRQPAVPVLPQIRHSSPLKDNLLGNSQELVGDKSGSRQSEASI
ncbi:putative Meiosis induction protein kinase [Taphrina deformans PYCC 5710]|uniref:Meiosis induction protein kinase n=1 Tax=Taphrina deformans (strain PYCC 5710 / ATCC 11124 / CBS 356.35 / IMI 108563 / JCM 9778 / NBRC 8474) TaxID=1097556 RepID=R4XBD6_TAPDE|nr:putative Meiosis induction protein kinase [Taphrina deformans PYCC 5710]|eukprot:CCG80648.1 putative Meiosis induction protein kinase [Taphrina deformans PYCC 5710]